MSRTLVWIRSGGAPEKGAVAFPLDSSGRRLILDGIASYFGLDPCSLTVGRVVLLKDASGLSVMDMDQVRQISLSAGLGDGLSEQTPIIITGTAAAASGAPSGKGGSQALDMVLKSLHKTVKGNRKRPGVDVGREWELASIRSSARSSEMYSGNGIYSYAMDLEDNKLPVGEAVSKFLGSVHIVRRTERIVFEGLADKRRKGVVTLVKPDGVCLTAEECIKGFEDDSEAMIVVKFPRLGASYECKVARCDNAVAILEPVQSQSFAACMAIGVSGIGPLAELCTFASYEELDVVPVIIVDCIQVHPSQFEVIFLPTEPLSELGAPVFDGRLGALSGVIVVVDGGKLPRRPRAARKLKTFKHGVELKVQSVADLDGELEILKRLSLAWKAEHGDDREYTPYSTVTKAIAHNQLAEYTFPVYFKTPQDDWNEKHPLESFSDRLPSKRQVWGERALKRYGLIG